MIGILIEMATVLYAAQARCEHCGKSEDFFTCDDCQCERERFLSLATDVLNVARVIEVEKMIALMNVYSALEGKRDERVPTSGL
jgi:hypothetical protein